MTRGIPGLTGVSMGLEWRDRLTGDKLIRSASSQLCARTCRARAWCATRHRVVQKALAAFSHLRIERPRRQARAWTRVAELGRAIDCRRTPRRRALRRAHGIFAAGATTVHVAVRQVTRRLAASSAKATGVVCAERGFRRLHRHDGQGSSARTLGEVRRLSSIMFSLTCNPPSRWRVANVPPL